jgi:hypothetical protein
MIETLAFVYALKLCLTTPPITEPRNPADDASERRPSAIVTGVTFDVDRKPTIQDMGRTVQTKCGKFLKRTGEILCINR